MSEHGLAWVHPTLPLAHPFDDGTAAVLARSPARTAASLDRVDADAWRRCVEPLLPEFDALMQDVLAPPLHVPRHPLLLLRFAARGLRSAVGLAHTWFRGPRARALFAGIAGHALDPLERVPTAAVGLLLALAGHAVGWPFARGGARALSAALSADLRRHGGTLVTGHRVDALATLRGAAAGRAPQDPLVVLTQPTLFDATRPPTGRHVAWAYVHVPTGSPVDATAVIEAQVERFAPGFRDIILARRSRTAAQLEAENPNLVGGDINGGSQDWRQVLCRPTLRLVPYATPVAGMFLCSAATPPGGGVHGMCGLHAARAVARHLDRAPRPFA